MKKVCYKCGVIKKITTRCRYASSCHKRDTLDCPDVPTGCLLYIYASKNEIIYREDPTNSSENYLRNRLRPLVKNLPDKNKKDLIRYLKLISNHNDDVSLKKISLPLPIVISMVISCPNKSTAMHLSVYISEFLSYFQ